MRPGTWSYYGRAVQRAIERVADGLDDPVDPEELARGAATSPFHFHRIFRGMAGETPLQLHRRLRLERAAWALLHGNDPVTTIALRAGYEAHEAFTRAFRAAYGCAPSEFRSEFGGAPAGPTDSRDADGSRATDGGRGEVDIARIELPTRSGVHYRPDMSVEPEFRPADDEHAEARALEVRIEELPELHLAAVRHVGSYRLLRGAFQRLNRLIGPAGLLRPETMVLLIYRDHPEITPEEELRSDVAITVPAGTELPEGLVSDTLPAGRYACATHMGPYAGLGDAWCRFMGAWLPASGERVADGPPFEVYRNDPAQTPQEKLRTDLFIPLE